MAAPKLTRLFALGFLFSILTAASATAQVTPGWTGGSSLKRADAPSGLSQRRWSFADRVLLPWVSPRWFPGRSPAGGSLGPVMLPAERRTWLQSRLP